jgi:XTP/dITP diphosphohydrolase
MKKVIIASNNEHKIGEIKKILAKFSLEVLSLKEAGIDIDVEENGNTFMENAYIKANEIFKISKGNMVLADDSGLQVDALGGAPGIYSARFAGEHGNDKKNREKLLELMKGKTYDESTAHFVCAIVLIVDESTHIDVQGEVYGNIIEEERGTNGFGYDSLFYIGEYDKTFAEMGGDIKNTISHRGKALEKLEKEFSNIYKNL